MRLLKLVKYVLLAYLVYLIIPIKYVNDEFKPYYNNYLTIVKSYCGTEDLNLPSRMSIDYMTFVYSKDLLGNCARFGSVSFFIGINESSWKKLDEDAKYQVITHELTHCVLEEMHSENPNNFMYFELNYLPRNIVNKQLIDIVKNKCHNKENVSRSGVSSNSKLFSIQWDFL